MLQRYQMVVMDTTTKRSVNLVSTYPRNYLQAYLLNHCQEVIARLYLLLTSRKFP